MALDASRPDPPLELVVLTASSETAYSLLPGAELVVGRAPGSDIHIDDASVSRRHAIVYVDGGVHIEDLGGANGTTVRAAAASPAAGETYELEKIRGRTAVAVGDCVTFGGITAVVRRRRGETTSRDGIVVSDPAVRAVHEQALRAAQSTISVLILGETGVGKEILATLVHARSPRADEPFVALNCASLSESLLESELFGHEKGAFTGAAAAHPGLFETAEGGTVFLDEIGDMPPSTQVKLLRVLEDRKVRRIGARAPRSVDVRFVAATNRDLEADAERGAFRQDLFFRLNGITLTLPPLRERTSEIPELARVFVAGASAQLARRTAPVLSDEALAALCRYRWPGNIRELRNALERAVVLASGPVLYPEHLPPRVLEQSPPRSGAQAGVADPRARLKDELDQLERERIADALRQNGGNQTLAAEMLGMSRRTMVTRMAEYDLPRPRKR